MLLCVRVTNRFNGSANRMVQFQSRIISVIRAMARIGREEAPLFAPEPLACQLGLAISLGLKE